MRDKTRFDLREERLEMFPNQAMQDRLLRPPPLVVDRVRRRGAQHGFALQSHPDANARTTIARHRDLASAKKSEPKSTEPHSKGVEEEMFSRASRDQ